MPVNLSAPDPRSLAPIAGVDLGWTQAGIRKAGRKDLLVIRLAAGTQLAAVFTRNRYCAAPVLVCREHLASAPDGIRALLVNTGCANAGTGESGLRDARASCDALARLLECRPGQVLPFSTGVIMEPLPMQRLTDGLPAAVASLAPDSWFEAAQAIMTTDTVPKAASGEIDCGGAVVRATGIAKGSGMIHPNMATMLGYLATDAAVDAAVLQALVRRVADASFNCITVDGDTSTNDSFVLMATGRADMAPIRDDSDPRLVPLEALLTKIAVQLAQAIVRDGEGATKFIRILVEQAGSVAEARAVAEAIARSPLVKTAFFASDPNLGRILAAIGNAGVADLDPTCVQLFLNDVEVASAGGRHPAYQEADGQRVMAAAEILVRVVLHRGKGEAQLWTCDLSHDYVSINADYRS